MANVTRYDDLHIVTRLFVSLLRAKKTSDRIGGLLFRIAKLIT